jgi:hypothetical protein
VASNRGLRSDDELGFLMAITDEWHDLEDEHQCVISFYILPGSRRGDLTLSLAALRSSPGGKTETVGVYLGQYPSHTANRLWGGLYRALVRLGVEIREHDRATGWVRPARPDESGQD